MKYTVPKQVLYLLLFILFIGMTQVSCKKEKLRLEKIYDDPAYAIGTVQSAVKIPFKVTYNYGFSTQAGYYQGKKIARGIGQYDGKLIGKSFLVVYSKLDINESDLNFDYRIDSQQMFDSLVVVFAMSPPKH